MVSLLLWHLNWNVLWTRVDMYGTRKRMGKGEVQNCNNWIHDTHLEPLKVSKSWKIWNFALRNVQCVKTQCFINLKKSGEMTLVMISMAWKYRNVEGFPRECLPSDSVKWLLASTLCSWEAEGGANRPNTEFRQVYWENIESLKYYLMIGAKICSQRPIIVDGNFYLHKNPCWWWKAFSSLSGGGGRPSWEGAFTVFRCCQVYYSKMFKMYMCLAYRCLIFFKI